MGREYAAVTREVPTGRWHEGSEAPDEGEGPKVNGRGPVRPWLLEEKPHGPLGQNLSIDPAPADGAEVRALAKRLPDRVNLTAYATRVVHLKI
jgi:hypothetical protein